MATKNTPQQTPKLGELIPERIMKLLGKPPILPFEDVEEFDALHAELVVQFDPKDMVEHFLVRDLAELRWEIMRLRGMRRAAIENSLPAAAAQLVPKQLFEAWGEEPHGSASEAESIAKQIIRKAARGDEEYRKSLASIIRVGGVTTDMLKVVAYIKDIRTISALDGEIAMEQHRFDQVVRNLEDRRKTNTAMARSFGGKSHDVVDVEVDVAEKEA